MTAANIARPNPSLATPELPKPRGKVWGRQFQKGQSGNPGGKPKAKQNIVDIAREASPKAMRTLISVMDDSKAPYSVRAFCANAVMDRAWGKAVQQTNLLVSSAQRPLHQLTDQELMEIIDAGRNAASLPAPAPSAEPPEIDGQATDIIEELAAEPDAAA